MPNYNYLVSNILQKRIAQACPLPIHRMSDLCSRCLVPPKVRHQPSRRGGCFLLKSAEPRYTVGNLIYQIDASFINVNFLMTYTLVVLTRSRVIGALEKNIAVITVTPLSAKTSRELRSITNSRSRLLL